MSGITQALIGSFVSGGSAIEYHGSSSALGTASASVTCLVPVGAEIGDLLIAFSNQTSTTTALPMTPPAGWVETLDESARWCGYLASWDGTASYTFTKGATSSPSVIMLAFKNAEFDVQGALSSGAASPVAPAITLSSSDSVVCACFVVLNSTTTTFTTPTGFTEAVDLYGQAASYKENVAAGSTGTVTATASAGTNSRAYLVGLKKK